MARGFGGPNFESVNAKAHIVVVTMLERHTDTKSQLSL